MPSSSRSRAWTNDGASGGPDSISIILLWLKTDDNYQRWSSGDNKVLLYREILAVFLSNGIEHRTWSGKKGNIYKLHGMMLIPSHYAIQM
ncbi:hypothetical protein PGT21_010109 [Puccinia graminis f. sp. tritici]|uniref:Uncharacterized protein n=1 Tax=Puccinia graminis f. sp. tritici TaxID=56615 RepID=A0A5B0PJS5_PUCGR|nr:hypothetical protein PGT21_010109 [Puccinia graminis f. sp. tritici]